MTTPDASRCTPDRPSTTGPNSSECTSRKPTPSWSTSPGSRSGQCRSISSIDTRPGRSANDTMAVWPETTHTTPGATRGTSPGASGGTVWSWRASWARPAPRRRPRATGPPPSPPAAGLPPAPRPRRPRAPPAALAQCGGHLPALRRPAAVLGAGQVPLAREPRGPAEPADQFLDRLPEPLAERLALGLAVVGEDDEVVPARRQRAGPVQAAELLVDAVQHREAVGALEPAVVSGLVVAQEVGVG